MSIKIDEDLQEILIQAGLDAAKRSEVMKIAKEFEEEKKLEKEEDKADGNKNKYRQVILVRGDEALKSLVNQAWIVKIVDENDGTKLVDTLTTCAARQNNKANDKKSTRGRKSKSGKIISFFQLFSWLKSKTLKEVATGLDEVKIVTKQPVEVQVLTTEDVVFSE